MKIGKDFWAILSTIRLSKHDQELNPHHRRENPEFAFLCHNTVRPAEDVVGDATQGLQNPSARSRSRAVFPDARRVFQFSFWVGAGCNVISGLQELY
jgi:hypothetical protein